MASKKENLELWNRVEKTDPKHTKKVKFGRQYTAIDPMYQIKSMTGEFGPVGSGWTWEAKHSFFHVNDDLIFAVADVVLKILPSPFNGFEIGPVRGMCIAWDNRLKDGNPKQHADTDAAKKATTDALTKAISQLGFNADVFLGKFDDVKYVQQLSEEFTGKEQEEAAAQAKLKAEAEAQDMIEAMLEKLGEQTTLSDFLTVKEGYKNQVGTMLKTVGKEWLTTRLFNKIVKMQDELATKAKEDIEQLDKARQASAEVSDEAGETPAE